MNFNNLSQTPLNPLTIETKVSSPTQSQIWSPFSTPCFSPFSAKPNSPFQYSYHAVHSPSMASRAISKRSAQSSPNPFGSNFINQPEQEIRYQSPIYSPRQQENNYSPGRKLLPKRSEQIDLSEVIRQAAIQRAMGARPKACSFCKTNGESEEIYSSHSFKDSNDKITCPILMRYSCPVCGASGEQAHTKKYCPQLQKKIRFEMLNKMTNKTNSKD